MRVQVGNRKPSVMGYVLLATGG